MTLPFSPTLAKRPYEPNRSETRAISGPWHSGERYLHEMQRWRPTALSLFLSPSATFCAPKNPKEVCTVSGYISRAFLLLRRARGWQTWGLEQTRKREVNDVWPVLLSPHESVPGLTPWNNDSRWPRLVRQPPMKFACPRTRHMYAAHETARKRGIKI